MTGRTCYALSVASLVLGCVAIALACLALVPHHRRPRVDCGVIADAVIIADAGKQPPLDRQKVRAACEGNTKK